MSFKYIRSGTSNSEPTTTKVKLANSAAVSLGMVVAINTSGFANVIGTISDKVAGVISNLYYVNAAGDRVIPSSSYTAGVFTASSANQTATTDIAYAEIITDPGARFEADWDATPTTNSLLTGGSTDVNVTGLTLANAASIAPATTGPTKNVVIISTNATSLKSIVKFNAGDTQQL